MTYCDASESTDCLFKYHGTGQPGRTTGRASSGMHGPRHAPDHGPRYYKPDHGPRYEPGRLLRAIVPLELRASGPPTLIHMDGHGGPAPWSLQPES